MRRQSQFLVLVATCIVIFLYDFRLKASEGTSRIETRDDLDIVQRYLGPVIRDSRLAVRIYYQADCRRANSVSAIHDPVPFPPVEVQPSLSSKTGITAVREIFRRDRNVTVKEGPSGVIRIWIGTVPTAILQTEIASLKLDAIAQYNPNQAFIELENTAELNAAGRLLGVAPVNTLSSTRAEPMDGLPHLPATIKKVTVDQFLDEMAKTWAGEGFVVYGSCSKATGPNGERWFWLDYAGDIFPK